MKKTLIRKSIPAISAMIAFICSTFLYGAGGNFGRKERPIPEYRKLINFIFGGGKSYVWPHEKVDQLDAFTGISVFGGLAFICLVIGVTLFVRYVINKQDKNYIISCCFIMLSGVFILLLLVAGTHVSATDCYWSYAQAFKNDNYKLGAGTIVWSVICVLGGGFGLFEHLCLKKNSQ